MIQWGSLIDSGGAGKLLGGIRQLLTGWLAEGSASAYTQVTSYLFTKEVNC